MSIPPPTRPVPHPTEDTTPFWDGCAALELRLQQCTACSHHRFPPALLCPRCWSRDNRWVVAGGRARLISHVVFHQQYHPAFSVPYCIGLVQLDEGPSLYAGIAGEIAGLARGTRLRLEWEKVEEGVVLPRFRAISDG